MKQSNLSWFLVVGLFLGLVGSFHHSIQLKAEIEELNAIIKSNSEVKLDDEILIVGNSILAGNDWTKLSSKWKIYNTSIPGITVFEANQNLAQLINRKAKYIIVNLGINDALAGATGKMITYEYIKFITAVNQHSPQSKIIVVSVLPVSESILKQTDKNKEISVLNTRIGMWCKNNHIPYMDINADFSKDGELDTGLTYDGIHLNENGYKVYEEKMKLYLKSIL